MDRETAEPARTHVSVEERSAVEAGLVVAEARLVEGVVDGGVLRGTCAGLACRLDVGFTDLTAAIDELEAVGWLAVERGPGGRLVLRWAEEAR